MRITVTVIAMYNVCYILHIGPHMQALAWAACVYYNNYCVTQRFDIACMIQKIITSIYDKHAYNIYIYIYIYIYIIFYYMHMYTL